MERLKPADDLWKPDGRTTSFVNWDTGKHISLEEQYAGVAQIRLNSSTPEDVRSYFATIQNLYVYAWFCYDFYPIVMFHCYAVIEMALRKRFPAGRKDSRGLGKLLKEAFKHNAIREKRFSFHRHRRKLLAEALWKERTFGRWTGTKAKIRIPVHKFEETLLESLTGLRNSLAHPEIHSIFTPGHAQDQLIFTAELINQLFPETH